MIEATGLTRYYGEFAALRDASFKIDDRQIVGFLGLNGAGKSTVLRILAGLMLPSAGRVTVGGLDATRDPDTLRRRVGFLPEEPPLYREMRVREFLEWCGRIKGRSKDEVRADLPRILETCQISAVADRVIGELSHGFKKRVGIAQAIVHRPEVVILDEPISGLDPQQIVEMRAVVKSLKETATVLISSHILSEIALTCDRVLVLHRGRLVAEGSEHELGKTLGEGTRLRLELRGTTSDVSAALESSRHVATHEVRSLGDGLVEATVQLSIGGAIEGGDAGQYREGLVADLVKAGVGVRGLQDAVSELEQIFLEFTRTAAADGDRPKVKA